MAPMGIHHDHCQWVVGCVEVDGADTWPRPASRRLGFAQQPLEMDPTHSSVKTSVLGREPKVVAYRFATSSQPSTVHAPRIISTSLSTTQGTSARKTTPSQLPSLFAATCPAIILILSASCAKSSFHLPSGYKRPSSVLLRPTYRCSAPDLTPPSVNSLAESLNDA
eukprot:5416526-Prymnesium_polylepis.2